MHVKTGRIGNTYYRCVRRETSVLVGRVIQFEDVCEKNIPGHPCCRRVKWRFDPTLSGVVDLDTAFELFRNSTPGGADCESNNVWNKIDENGDVPGDENIGSGPEEPGRDRVCDIGAVLGTVGLEVVDTEKDRSGNKQASGYGRSNERGKEKDNDSGKRLARKKEMRKGRT